MEDSYFCSVCGKVQEDPPKGLQKGEWWTPRPLRYTLMNGNVVCHFCWEKRNDTM